MTRPFLYLPTGQLVMCGWSQTSPLRTFPIWSIFCQQPPSPLQHSVHVIYQSLPLPINWARSQASNMTVTAGGLQKRSLPLRRAGTTGHRAVDGQSHVTVWGPQTLGGGCTRCKQALTATMTNNTHICRKCSYLYQLQPSNNQVTAERWSEQESKDTDMKHKTKQASVWQHQWASSQLAFKQNTFILQRCRFTF